MTTTARDATLALLVGRSPDATVCPSEVARAIASEAGWRDAMPTVHSAVDRLFAEGLVRLSWKGQLLAARTGPYRIGRGAGAGSPAFGAGADSAGPKRDEGSGR